MPSTSSPPVANGSHQWPFRMRPFPSTLSSSRGAESERGNWGREQECSARYVLFPRGGKFLTCPGVDAAGADGPHWFAGCGMLVAGGFCYGRLLDESSIARESQNSPDSCGGEFLTCPLRPAPQHRERKARSARVALAAQQRTLRHLPARRRITPAWGVPRYAAPFRPRLPSPRGRSRPSRRSAWWACGLCTA